MSWKSEVSVSGLPTALPSSVNELIEQLVELNPPPVIEGPISEDQIHIKLVQCGRYQVVQELRTLAENARHG